MYLVVPCALFLISIGEGVSNNISNFISLGNFLLGLGLAFMIIAGTSAGTSLDPYIATGLDNGVPTVNDNASKTLTITTCLMLSFSIITLLLDSIVTISISVHLYIHRRQVSKLLGSDYASNYTSIMSIFIESAVINITADILTVLAAVIPGSMYIIATSIVVSGQVCN